MIADLLLLFCQSTHIHWIIAIQLIINSPSIFITSTVFIIIIIIIIVIIVVVIDTNIIQMLTIASVHIIIDIDDPTAIIIYDIWRIASLELIGSFVNRKWFIVGLRHQAWYCVHFARDLYGLQKYWVFIRF